MPSEPQIGDAFGLDLKEHLHGDGSFKTEIVERDDGYIDASNTFDYFAEYNDWPIQEQKLAAFATVEVLDVGCGAGRHSLYFQEKGLNVTAIDRSPTAIEVCRERGVRNAKVLSFEEVKQLKPQVFDTVVMFGHNLGLLGDPQKGKKLLETLKTVTKPGSKILGTTRDPYTTKDPVHLAYHQLNRDRGRLPGHLTLRVRHKNLTTPWFDYLFTSQEELENILDGTGWTIQEYVSGKDGSYGVVITRQ